MLRGFCVIPIIITLGCAKLDDSEQPPFPVAAFESWDVLFDGADASRWRTYGRDSLCTEWQIIDGALTLTEAGGGDITTGELYDNFDLVVEWSVEPGGNSGIFYGVNPAEDRTAGMSGVEYQLLDNERHPNGQEAIKNAGAAFALYPATTDATNPAPAFNVSRLIVNNRKAQHWMNGELVAEYDLDSKDFSARVAVSKFAKVEGFGKTRSGLIVLQDHSDRVQFRTIRIRRL